MDKHIMNTLTQLQQRQINFLDSTVLWFSQNPRGMADDGQCRYSEGCAIGRFLEKPEAERFDELTKNSVSSIFEELPNQLKDLGIAFLQDVQTLHDGETSWITDKFSDYCGLSNYGIVKYERIKARIMNNYNGTKVQYGRVMEVSC
jgi:hypothetical protein